MLFVHSFVKMKIKHYPGKAVMEDPWLSINDRTMDLVYAANWIGARNLSNYSEHNNNSPKYNSISRSKSCRDVTKNGHKDYDEEEYSKTNNVSQNISQLAKYQQNIEEKSRANNNLINTQHKLKYSYSFKDMPNGYKPSTLRRVKRRNFTEWDIESFGQHKHPPVPPQRKDSLKYAHRQRKADSKKNQYPLPDPGPVPADPSSESYYEYYSRVSQQINDTDNDKLKQLQKDNSNKKNGRLHNEEKKSNKSTLFNNDTVYHLINSMATLDLNPNSSRSGSNSISSDIDQQTEDSGLFMREINDPLPACDSVPEYTPHQASGRNMHIDDTKPSFRSKSLRIKSEGRAPLRAYLDVVHSKSSGNAPYDEVTVTQPKRNLSPSEQLTMMHYDMASSKLNNPTLPSLSDDTSVANSGKESDYRTANGVVKQIKHDKYGKLYNTVRVKSDDRYERYNDILSLTSNSVRNDDHQRFANGSSRYSRSAKSSSSGSDSDFSIPRPKLIVPVHTYGIRKRRTGNLCQRDSTSTETLDAEVVDVHELENSNKQKTARKTPGKYLSLKSIKMNFRPDFIYAKLYLIII